MVKKTLALTCVSHALSAHAMTSLPRATRLGPGGRGLRVTVTERARARVALKRALPATAATCGHIEVDEGPLQLSIVSKGP